MHLDVVRGGASPRMIEQCVGEFISMHQERWTASGQRGALYDAKVQAFHREVVMALAERGATFFAFLVVDGRRLGCQYGFVHRSELAIYLTGMREPGQLRRHSPGRGLTSVCMEWAIAQGLSTYDFMRGTEPYKYDFGGVDVGNDTLIWRGHRAMLPAQRHRMMLLAQGLARRIVSERALWHHIADAHGPLSPSSLAHIRARAAGILRDARLKWRAPEKSLSAHAGRPTE